MSTNFEVNFGFEGGQDFVKFVKRNSSMVKSDKRRRVVRDSSDAIGFAIDVIVMNKYNKVALRRF